MEEVKELKVCRLSCYYNKFSFIWPSEDEEFNPSKWFYIKLALFFVGLNLSVSSMLAMHISKALQEGGIDISEDIAVCAALIRLQISMLMYAFKQQKLVALFLDLSDFKKFGKPQLFDIVNKKVEAGVRFVFYYAMFGSVIYNSIKIIDIPNCRRLRKIRETCGVIVPFWTPFDADDWPILLLVTLYVFIFIVTIDRGIVVVPVHILEISINIKLRIDHLNSKILTCFDGDERLHRQRLNHCIRYHTAIIDYCERFNSCFTSDMFVLLVTEAIICGCLENQVAKKFTLGVVIHIFAWISALFVLCAAGQIIQDSTASVADAVYHSKWYEADVKLRRDLILFIMRSQKPLFLTTGAFDVLTFSLFVSVMKMSYSILTLLS